MKQFLHDLKAVGRQTGSEVCGPRLAVAGLLVAVLLGSGGVARADWAEQMGESSGLVDRGMMLTSVAPQAPEASAAVASSVEVAVMRESIGSELSRDLAISYDASQAEFNTTNNAIAGAPAGGDDGI